jgi:hypothetical protein
MKVDIDCIIRGDEAEIGISLIDRISQQEFEEYANTLKREGFEYDPYNKSNFFTTKNPKMLAAMLKFLNKEFDVSAKLKGEQTYTWDERDQFVKEFDAMVKGEKKEEIPETKKE